GDAESGMRNEKEQDDSGKGRGQCGDDDEWVEPRLEIHDDQQIHQDDRKTQTANQSYIGGPHRAVLTAKGNKATAWKQFAVSVDDPVHLTSYRTQIPALDRRIDVDSALDVVVVDRDRLNRPLDRRDVCENPRLLLSGAG